MAVDGSTTPVVYSCGPPPDTVWLLARLILYMESATAMDSTTFGDIAALANGVSVKCNNHNIATWRDNVDIMTCMYDVEGRAIFAKATKSMSARWTFTKATLKGDPLICERKHGFQIVINDNISGLTSFKIAVQGQARLINSR
jgi:hypothetical protein